jgi:hypothetical protein
VQLDDVLAGVGPRGQHADKEHLQGGWGRAPRRGEAGEARM